MKSLIITNRGCEEAVKKELETIFGITKIESKDYTLKFDVDNYEKLIEICYRSQSAAKVLLLIEEFEFKSLDELKDQIKKLDLKDYFEKESTFSSRVGVFDNKEINKQELEAEIGEAILNSLGKKSGVNLESPDIHFYTFIKGKKVFFGIDLAGFDLSQREYKLFTGRNDLKGNVGFSLLMTADYDGKMKILDPFTRNGVIPIEAALFSLNFPVNYYKKDKFAFRRFPKLSEFDFDSFFESIDKEILEENTQIFGSDSMLKNVKAAQKNAKVAGILKRINLTRLDTEWIDTKFKKEEVDSIITLMPSLNKLSKKENVEKYYNELFHQSVFALKKDGKMVLVSNSEELINKNCEKHGFKVSEKKNFWQGDLCLDVFVIIKK